MKSSAGGGGAVFAFAASAERGVKPKPKPTVKSEVRISECLLITPRICEKGKRGESEEKNAASEIRHAGQELATSGAPASGDLVSAAAAHPSLARRTDALPRLDFGNHAAADPSHYRAALF